MRLTSSIYLCLASLIAIFSIVSLYFQSRIIGLHSFIFVPGTIDLTHFIRGENQQEPRQRHHQDEEHQEHPRIWRSTHKPPRRFFAFANASAFYAEPRDNGKNQENIFYQGDYEAIPRYPYSIPELTPINASDPNIIISIQRTMHQRLNALLHSDATTDLNTPPKFLPPQFPQRDRSVSYSLAHTNTSYFVGFPPTCCPLKRLPDNSLVENAEVDCTCHSSPKGNFSNYPADGIWPKVTLVSAFFQFASKHGTAGYKSFMRQILQSSDPLVIYLEPSSEWITYVKQQRKHAPTIIVPRLAKDMVCANTFSTDHFWRDQHERLNPERDDLHKGVSMHLYAVWCEKILLVEAVARLNPFNTTTMAWIDVGIARNPRPHLWRSSIVHINVSDYVDEHAVLSNQVWPYRFNQDQAYNPVFPIKQIISVGSMYIGSLMAFDNLYSAYYDVIWSMALEDIFVGEDQCVLYRACHTYPSACHVHTSTRMYDFNAFIKENQVLHGPGAKISKPLQLTPIEPRPAILPVPPLIVTKAYLSSLQQTKSVK